MLEKFNTHPTTGLKLTLGPGLKKNTKPTVGKFPLTSFGGQKLVNQNKGRHIEQLFCAANTM